MLCREGYPTYVENRDRLGEELRAGGAQHYHSSRAKHYSGVRSHSAVRSINARQVVLMLQEPCARSKRTPPPTFSNLRAPLQQPSKRIRGHGSSTIKTSPSVWDVSSIRFPPPKTILYTRYNLPFNKSQVHTTEEESAADSIDRAPGRWIGALDYT